jgi:CRISPR/Cas system-associated exonuclease Cas4 (RecB family)
MAPLDIVLKEINGSHHYWVDGTYCYSVTALLDQAAPMHPQLREWLKRQTPESADSIRDEAGEFGTKIHKACERLLLGDELDLERDYPKTREKQFIVSFANWYNDTLPRNMKVELKVGHLDLRYAGTLDLYCEIGDQKCIIDYKTSSSVRLNHELQITAYKEAYQEMYGVKIDKTYVLRLGSRHKRGYELKEVDRPFSHFKSVYDTFITLNDGQIPDPPLVDVYPKKLQIIKKSNV